LRIPSDRNPGVAILAADRALGDRVKKKLSTSDFEIVAVSPLSRADAFFELLDGRGKAGVVVVVVVKSIEKLDGSLPGGFERFERPVVCCTDPVDTATLRRALDKGVDGVVWNTELDEKLVPTIKTVCAGQLVFPAQLRRQTKASNLTNREKQVLSLVVMGLTNRQIAQNLFVSDSTVKSHLNTAYRKLGVGSRVEAAELITDPEKGLGTGILAITSRGHARVARKES
jgi:DNA-binding CsgD family transcriptional regulator